MLQRTDELKFDLAIEALQVSGLLRLKVRGNSMLPSLWPGDLVTVQAASFENLRIGDIVLYSRDSRFFTHRLQHKTETLIAIGDCMSAADPPIAPSQVLGRVISVRRYGTELPVPDFTISRRVQAYLLRRCEFLPRLALWVHAKNVRRSAGLPKVNPEYALQ
jgi:Peptidase S24-like